MPDESNAPDRSMETVYANQVARRLAAIAVRLREMAAAVDRAEKSVATVGKERAPKSYAWIATDVQHDVLWSLANLNLDGLTDAAHEADEYRTRRRDAEAIAVRIEARATAWPGMSDAAEAGNEHLRQAARIAREYGEG